MKKITRKIKGSFPVGMGAVGGGTMNKKGDIVESWSSPAFSRVIRIKGQKMKIMVPVGEMKSWVGSKDTV